MDHGIGLGLLVVLMVFGPLLAFFYKSYTSDQKRPIEAAEELLNSWKDPAPLIFNLPFDLVIETVVEELPRFSYANGVWQIINVEDGIPTRIASNLPCLDESDPGNVQRLDVGLITSITDQGPEDSGVMVRLHFIPYEGLELPLQSIGERTYDHLDKALRRTVTSIYGNAGKDEQPPVVPAEITYPASSGAPSEPASDFFAQSSDYAAPDAPLNSFASEAEPAPNFMPEPLPLPMPVSEPAAMPAPIPAPVPAEFPLPMPAPFLVPTPIAMPEPIALQDVVPASSGGADGASLCPGCSLPINPSFPFCLYCGKNF